MIKPIRSIPDQESDAHDNAVKILQLYEQRTARAIEHQFTPRNYLNGIRFRLSKCEIAYLEALIPSLRGKHYKEVTQRRISEKSKWCIRSIKDAQSRLSASKDIQVIHQYHPYRKNQGRPSRKASIVWLIGFTRELAWYIEGKDFSAIPASSLLSSLKPETRLVVRSKIPCFIGA